MCHKSNSLEQALADRNKPRDVICHSDRGVQYLSIHYIDRMKDMGLTASVGATSDSYDDALAESLNELYRAEVINYLKEQWCSVNDVELATLEWVNWFNKTRLHSAINYVSHFQFEKRYYDSLALSGEVA